MEIVEAGREMDLLVAEHVMGYSEDFIIAWEQQWEDGDGRYSTDIAAAWEVLEHLSKTGHWRSSITHDYDFSFEVELNAGDPNCSHNKDYDPEDGHGWSIVDTEDYMKELDYRDLTAPEAICIAALRAMKVEIFNGGE